MTYGIQVFDGLQKTKLGPSDNTMRLIFFQKTSMGGSGSVTVSEFNDSDGNIAPQFFVNKQNNDWEGGDGKYPDFSWSWDESTKTLTWDNPSDGRADFLFVMYK